MQQRWRSLAALTVARAAMGFQFQTVAALAPLLQRDLGLDKAQPGWLIGLYLLPFAVPCSTNNRAVTIRRMLSTRGAQAESRSMTCAPSGYAAFASISAIRWMAT